MISALYVNFMGRYASNQIVTDRVAILLVKNGAKRLFLDRRMCAVDVRRQRRMGEVAFWLSAFSLAYVENHVLCCQVGVYLIDAELWR